MKSTTVDEYINGFTQEKREKLLEMRNIIRSTLPDCSEALKWGAPATIDKDGMILIVFSGHKDHMNLVGTQSTLEAFHDECKEYETGKGSVKLRYDKPLPKTLIEAFILYRANEYRENGIKWK